MFAFVVEQCEANVVQPTLQIRCENMTVAFAPVCGLPKHRTIDPTAKCGSLSFPTWDGRVFLRWDEKTVQIEHAALSNMTKETIAITIIKSDKSFETALQAWVDFERDYETSESQNKTDDVQSKKHKHD